jgi:hypothetical protein
MPTWCASLFNSDSIEDVSMRKVLAVVALGVLFAGCVPTYTLVKPEPVKVAAGKLMVRPPVAWNRVPHLAFQIPQQETWTQNGVMLDSIDFIAALPDGKAITKQRPKDARKVPVFRAGMTPQDLVSMVESYYRIKAGANVFETTGVKPVKFVGSDAVQFDFSYAGADEVKRRGRCVLAVNANKLYLMTLDGAAVHYFDTALPQFEALVASATIA